MCGMREERGFRSMGSQAVEAISSRYLRVYAELGGAVVDLIFVSSSSFAKL